MIKYDFNKNKPSLLINTLSNWLVVVVNIIIGLLITPYIIKRLGTEGYGIWTLIISLIGYYGLFNLGISSAIDRYIARYSAQKNVKALNQTASTAFLLFCLFGILTIVLSLILPGFLSGFFSVPSHRNKEFVYLIILIGTATGINFPSCVFSSIIIAREKFVFANIVYILRILIRAILSYIFIENGFGLISIGIATFLSIILTTFLSYINFKIFAGDIKISLYYIKKNALKKIISFGSITTIIIAADLIRINLDNIIIGRFVSLESVGIYSISAMIIRYVNKLTKSGLSVLTPRFTAIHGIKEFSKLKILFIKSTFLTSFFVFGLMTAILIFGNRFIEIWIGNGYELSVKILNILSIAYMFELSQQASVNLMYSINKHKIYAYIILIESLIKIILSLFFVKKYGTIGVAYGTLISMLITKIAILPYYTSKLVNISVIKYISLFLPSVILNFSILIIFYISNLDFYVNNISVFNFLFVCITYSIIYGIFILAFQKAKFTFQLKL